MNFCAKCGRERPGDARYCGGCGTEFEADSAAATPSSDDSGGGDPQRPATVDAPVVAGTPAEPEPPEPPEPHEAAAEPAQWDIPATAAGDWAPVADATRVERQPDATMIDRPGRAGSARAATPAEPDPFAAWFAPDSQAAPPTQQRQAAEPWQAADTVYAGSGQQSSGYQPQGYPPQAYPPPSPAAPGYPPPQPPYGAQPGPPSGGKPSSGGRKTGWIVLVVLVMLAAGGGAYALVAQSGKHNTAQPTITPTTASSAASSAPASTGPSTSPTSAGPSASATATAAASASPSPSLVTVGAGVGSNTAEPAVETTLSQYFQGINTHNYTEYQNVHTAAVQATEPESAFNSGYGSTKDSGMTLLSLDNGASDSEEATVTFTSRQDPSASIDGSACNQWKVTYFLVPHGHGYLIGSSPTGYKPSYSDC